MNKKYLAFLASLLGLTGVLFGAFGAHALKGQLTAEMLSVFEVGVRYQMYHVVPLFFISSGNQSQLNRMICFAQWFLLMGVLIFSGSLYLLALTSVKSWGAVTPVGGISLIIGWLLLGLGILNKKEI